MNKLFTFLGFCIFSSLGFSQQFCATDQMHVELLQNPHIKKHIETTNKKLDSLTLNFTSNRTATYIIPVVFHVVHNYGVENISDAQIYDAVKQVNIQMRKLNADTTAIHPTFKNRAADVDIEIRLAQLDPDGNCTNGITRHASPLTLPGDHEVKSIVHWPPNQYLNIYICKDAAGLAGHALLPAAADTIPQWDGIVMRHDYIGTIGTSDNFRRTVLTHEIGHYFNLQHIWGGNNVPDYYYLPVGNASNCSHDDGVLDTPETIGWSTCSSNPQSCSTLDNIQNYMDYAYCALMFTEGQKTRMHAALNSSIANRNNLWLPANLIATGTDGTQTLCQAKLQSTKTVICAGETVDFSDISYHGVTTRNWNFEMGTPTSTTDSSVTVTYTTPGLYDVTLQVSNGIDNETITLTDYITVLPTNNNPAYIEESFEIPTLFSDKWITNNNGPLLSSITANGFQSYNAYKMDNLNAIEGTTFELYTKPIDASSYNEVTIQFDHAYTQQNASNHDKFQVLISNDCGDSWTVRKTLYGDINLSPGTITTSEYIPSDGDWVRTTVTVPQALLSSTFMVKFTLTNDGGNNMFLDNINIVNTTELGIDNDSELDFNIYPNPADEFINVRLSQHDDYQFTITDMTGRTIFSNFYTNSQEVKIPLNIANGMYLFTIENGVHSVSKTFVKH